MACLMRQIVRGINLVSSNSGYNIQNNFKPKTNTCATLCNSWFTNSANYHSNAPTPYEIVDPKEEQTETNDVFHKINQQISKSQQGRLFAVVHVAGKQFKVTDGDLIVIEGYWPPDVGDNITLDKVLLAGAADFTLIGRPTIEKGLVNVKATVIEKSLSHTKTHFRKKRRKQYMRINFYRIPQTMLRINNVEIVGEINNPREVTGLDTAIF